MFKLALKLRLRLQVAKVHAFCLCSGVARLLLEALDFACTSAMRQASGAREDRNRSFQGTDEAIRCPRLPAHSKDLGITHDGAFGPSARREIDWIARGPRRPQADRPQSRASHLVALHRAARFLRRLVPRSFFFAIVGDATPRGGDCGVGVVCAWVSCLCFCFPLSPVAPPPRCSPVSPLLPHLASGLAPASFRHRRLASYRSSLMLYSFGASFSAASPHLFLPPLTSHVGKSASEESDRDNMQLQCFVHHSWRAHVWSIWLGVLRHCRNQQTALRLCLSTQGRRPKTRGQGGRAEAVPAPHLRKGVQL